MKQFGEIIDDVLVLASALNGGIALLKRIQRGLQDFDGFRLGGFRRLRQFAVTCSSSWVICLTSGAVAAYAPKLRLKANRKVYIRRTA